MAAIQAMATFLSSTPVVFGHSDTRIVRHCPCRSHLVLSACWSRRRYHCSYENHRVPFNVFACGSSSSPSFSSVCTSSNTTKIFVSGLSFRTTRDSLINAFGKFGQLTEVNLVMDKIANRPRGFAFLSYATEDESRKAIEGMHGKFLDGRVIFVEVTRPRSDVRNRTGSLRPHG